MFSDGQTDRRSEGLTNDSLSEKKSKANRKSVGTHVLKIIWHKIISYNMESVDKPFENYFLINQIHFEWEYLNHH